MIKKFIYVILISLGLFFVNNKQENIVWAINEGEESVYLEDLYEGVMPSTGDVKVLVILIEFPDYIHSETKYSHNFVSNYLFGPSDYPHESISSFYNKSSLGKLNIEADVLGWYKTKNRSNYYTSNYRDYASDYIIIEALEYYESQGYDFSIYDANNDGFVDAVYALYSRNFDSRSDTWWAYQTFLENEFILDNKIICNYMWASVSFIESDGALTFIHETGHLMGLDDYYDYNEYDGPRGGLGGADLMDDTQGDHGPISKIILGWIEPIIVETKDYFDLTIDLKPFVSSGEVLLITPEYNGIYGEYFLVDFYTPTSLNESNTYFTQSGIRIYHVNSEIGSGGDGGEYQTVFEYDNSDTKYKFVNLIEADGRGDILKGYEATNSDLFTVGQVFSKQTKPNNLMYSGKDPEFTLSILSVDQETVQIKITSTHTPPIEEPPIEEPPIEEPPIEEPPIEEPVKEIKSLDLLKEILYNHYDAIAHIIQ